MPTIPHKQKRAQKKVKRAGSCTPHFSLQTEIQNICATQLYRTKVKTVKAAPLPPPHLVRLRQLSAVRIQRWWRKNRLSQILNRYQVIEDSGTQSRSSCQARSILIDFQTSRTYQFEQEEQSPHPCNRTFSLAQKTNKQIISTAEPQMPEARPPASVSGQHSRQWISLVHLIKQDRRLYSQKTTAQLKRNIDFRRIQPMLVLKDLQLNDLVDYACLKYKLQRLQHDPNYPLEQALLLLQQAERKVNSTARQFRRSLTSPRIDLLAQDLIAEQADVQHTFDDNDKLSQFSDYTPRVEPNFTPKAEQRSTPSALALKFKNADALLEGYLVEQLIAQIFSGKLLQRVQALLKPVKVTFPQLSLKKIDQFLNSVPSAFERVGCQVYQLQKQFQSLCQPFLLPLQSAQVTTDQPFPLKFIQRPLLQKRLKIRAQFIQKKRTELVWYIRQVHRLYLQAIVDGITEQMQVAMIRLRNIGRKQKGLILLFDKSLQAVRRMTRLQRVQDRGQTAAYFSYLQQQDQFANPIQTTQHVLQVLSDDILHKMYIELLEEGLQSRLLL